MYRLRIKIAILSTAGVPVGTLMEDRATVWRNLIERPPVVPSSGLATRALLFPLDQPLQAGRVILEAGPFERLLRNG